MVPVADIQKMASIQSAAWRRESVSMELVADIQQEVEHSVGSMADQNSKHSMNCVTRKIASIQSTA